MNKYQAIWLTGQPASGKTTLANMLIDNFNKNGHEKDFYNIDGDDLRDLFQNKDYSRKGIWERKIKVDLIEKRAGGKGAIVRQVKR